MKKLLLSLCLASFLYSNETVEVSSSEVQENGPVIDIEYLNSLEKGHTRDFYINEYLKENITSEQASLILPLVDNMSNEIFFNFAKKFKHDETLAVAQCMNMDANSLVNSYADCMVAGLSIKDMSKLSAIDYDLIKQKTENKYPTFRKRLKVLFSAIPFTKLVVQKKDEFYNIFFNVDETFRTKYFNYKLPKRTFDKIFKDKEKFNKFLEISLSNQKLDMLHKSLINVDDSNLSVNSSFLLALNAIKLNDLENATKYLNNSVLKTSDLVILDKVKFWQYQISKDKTILEELANSSSLNFYSYLANEMLKKKIKTKKYVQRNELFDFWLKKYDKKRVALLYAIAKSESNFEPALISDDFKVGMMQLKPSFVKNISNSLNEEYNILNQFQPVKNLEFANIHLNSLENVFKTPLFLSLIYDGKTEFLNWNLKNDIFKSNTLYEPFLGLEYLLNGKLENKKELLLDYVLYHNLLTKKRKEKITLLSICQNLVEADQK